ICYRLYDADIPQYAVAADLYENFLHIQEYEAPKTIDEKLAKKRLRESVRVLKEVLKIPDDRIFLKVRRKQKGLSQYESSDEEGEYHVVHEGGLKFLVNFSGYLDTGLFLDHRKTRFMIRDLADKKDFLNLFAYTGSASVYAAAGGALSTTTVDMSRTYLEWAEKNMKLNGLAGPEHVFIRDNCLEWIQSCTNTFDLIFLDPPTFSNSSRMEGTLEIQRDHAGMIRNTAKLLKKGGIILFSNNFRNFKMDSDLLSEFKIKNITNDTIQKDFTGNPKIHNCWLIERTET
ncbi:MAG: class I SAM-dependent methyltransferase, partial [Spirochaetia bacterium]|nr:class I SAM-dependent methyltransferase [Spirochaetia bacterium]